MSIKEKKSTRDDASILNIKALSAREPKFVKKKNTTIA